MWKVPFYFNCDCDSVTDFTFTHSFSTRPFSAVVLLHFCLPFRPSRQGGKEKIQSEELKW